MWRFPKIKGTFLGVPIISTSVFWGLYWGPPIIGSYHVVSHVSYSLNSLYPPVHTTLGLQRVLSLSEASFACSLCSFQLEGGGRFRASGLGWLSKLWSLFGYPKY